MSPETIRPTHKDFPSRQEVVPREFLSVYESLVESFNQAGLGDIFLTQTQRKTYPGTRQGIGASNVVVELKGEGDLLLFAEIMVKSSSIIENMTSGGKNPRPEAVLKTLLQEEVASSRHKQQMIQQALAILEKSSNPISRLLNQEPPSAHDIALATQTLKEFVEIRPRSIESVGEIKELLELIIPCVDVVVLDLVTDDLRKVKGITEAQIKSDEEKGELSLKIQYALDENLVDDAPRNELNIESDKTSVIVFGTRSIIKVMQKKEREKESMELRKKIVSMRTSVQIEALQPVQIDSMLISLPYDLRVVVPRVSRDEVSRGERWKAKLQAEEFVFGEGFSYFNPEKHEAPKKIKGYISSLQDALGRVLQVTELRDKFYTSR